MDIKETLTKRAGPLPVWGWGAVVIGGAVIFLMVRRKYSGGATGTQQDTLGFGNTTGGGGGGGGPTGGGSDTTTKPPGGGNGNVPDITNPGEQSKPTRPGTNSPTDTSWQPNAVAPISDAEEAAIRAGRATSDIASKVIANNIASTVEGAAQQVRNSNSLIGLNVGVVGATPMQLEQYRQNIAGQLVQRGFTASSYGGQIYAARDNNTFFWGLPPAARENLARLLQAQARR